MYFQNQWTWILAVLLTCAGLQFSDSSSDNSFGAEVPKGTLNAKDGVFSVTPMTEPATLPTRQFKCVKTEVLTDAKDLSQWTDGDCHPITHWELKDGILHPTGKATDIFYKGDYHYFILEFEFEVPFGGNSGVFYYSWSDKLKARGYEYQIIDDVNRKTNPEYERFGTGGLYAMYHRKYDAGPRLRDGFNKGKIVVMGNHIEHWLNDKLAVSVQTGSSNWFEHVASSRFAQDPKFGKASSGRIALQYHNYDVRFRNIRLSVFEETK